jgi:methylenetetrahydrofolate dehydrogenase (NADP+)/methenyltetrahydrofolate cyclohydrolase
MAKILDGKIVATEIAEKLKSQIHLSGRRLTLGIVQVGDNPNSAVYIQHKVKMAQRLGVEIQHENLPQSTSQIELINKLQQWNSSSNISGYIVQLPLPQHMNTNYIINHIDPQKDVDGLTVSNRGALAASQPAILPATTRGILSLLDYYDYDLEGRNVAVIGRSNLVGLPTALALLQRNATVTILHSKSKNYRELLKSTDIVVVAVGKPGFLDSNMLSPKSIVIDVGIANLNGKLYGDVDFEDVKDKVEAITPVPGGIGPLTVISLFQNLVDNSSL